MHYPTRHTSAAYLRAWGTLLPLEHPSSVELKGLIITHREKQMAVFYFGGTKWWVSWG
jgi:hypothetical protein